jgi:TonB-dependent starch-binding outer membrane protein SusC
MRKNTYLGFLSHFRMAIMMVVLLSAPNFLGMNSLAAQQSASSPKITGTVKDEQGLPMPGVSVKVTGTTQVTITDINGKFSISTLGEKATLDFRYIGYDSQIIPTTGKTVVNVQLNPSDRGLNEVVVVGYGTRKAKDLTGNISSVSSRDFEKAPVTNAEALIANKISGVQVLPSSGKPGAGSSFLIQGGASLNASNDPLIVIDGLPIEGWNNGPGIISQLNPNDIENFTVLKDASASAIYGSRASNGVILITTKKGNKGKMQVDFTSNLRLSTVRDKTSVLSADQYRALATEIGSGMKITPGAASTDWQNEIFRNAFAHDYNLSLSGSIKSLPYRVSGAYTNQDGTLKTGNYERATASINLNPSFLNDKLKININLKGSYENERIANQSAIWSAITFDPTQPVRVDDQTYGGYYQYSQYASNPYLTNINPVSMLEQVNEKNKTYRSLGNIQADYSFFFLPELHLNVNAGYDISTSAYSYNAPATYFAQILSGGKTFNGNPSRTSGNKIFESYLFYSKELSSIKSKFDVTAGYSYNDFMTTNYNYSSYSADGTLIASSVPTYAFDKPSHSIVSFYGRLNYTLNDKYLLTASIRDDASSRFAEKHRWGLFPSMALAWKIKEESFLKNSKIISDMKLRMGYGITGQQDGLDNYYPIKRYTTSGLGYQYTMGNTAYTTVFPQVYNPDLKWEETATANVGLDYGFFEHRITGSINLYQKNTKDLLNSVTIPYGYSFSSTMMKNIGSMENKGIEFNVKAIAVQTKDITWDLSFNATYNENEITKLSLIDDNSVGLFSNATLVNTIGYARNNYYLYHQVYDVTGKPIEDQMLDVNGDGLTNAKDRYVTGKSSIPKYLFGFNTNFQYKKWSVGASFHANVGHYIYYMPQENAVALIGWSTSQNLNTSYYKSLFRNTDQYEGYSDYYLQNASFLKMDNAYLGYDFGKIIRGNNMTLKMNVSVQNIFTITKFTGLDPETNSGSQNAYPIPRVFAFGLNLNF